MNCLRPLEHWNLGFESHSRHGCLSAVILCLCCSVCRYRPCDGLIPRPKSLTDCPKIRKLKWNEAFHGCPMLQSGSNRRERQLMQYDSNSLCPLVPLVCWFCVSELSWPYLMNDSNDKVDRCILFECYFLKGNVVNRYEHFRRNLLSPYLSIL
jgi:hypothetical protein